VLCCPLLELLELVEKALELLLLQEIAVNLNAGKEEKARIKAEQLIQQRRLECAMDILVG